MVQVEAAEQFVSKVNNAGGMGELHIYEGAGHAFLNKPDSKPEVQIIVSYVMDQPCNA